jgi:myo-inositol 2-dehydrogenase/D-chiro-inositol 1-dehydrogenase
MKTRKVVRLAYIGAGGFTNAYMYPQLSAHAVELVGVCDLVEEKARQAAEQYRFRAVYTDFKQMLAETRPEAVICVGGPKVHYGVGREVLKLGYPLYIQKSPAPTAAQTQEMADLAAEAGVVCHVGLNLRHARAVVAAKEIMARPEFGPVTLVMVRYGLVSGATLKDAVYDQHCHAYDMLRDLGGNVVDLKAQAGNVCGARSYAAAVKYECGAAGSVNFTSGQIVNKEFVYFEVTGTGGHFVSSHDFNLRYRRIDGPDEVLEPGNFAGGLLKELQWLGYVDDVESFLQAVRGEEPDPAPVSDAVGTMELCEEAYRQLREQGAEE